jgi:hypothetical protein
LIRVIIIVSALFFGFKVLGLMMNYRECEADGVPRYHHPGKKQTKPELPSRSVHRSQGAVDPEQTLHKH